VLLAGALALASASASHAQVIIRQIDGENMVSLGDGQLEALVFGNQGLAGRAGLAPGAAEQALQLQIDFVAAAAGDLSDEQRFKLELAGRGDVERFLDRFETLKRGWPAGAVTLDRYTELQREAIPLRTRFQAGLHGRGSLFRKVIPSVLDAGQLAEYRRVLAERNRRHYEALVRAAVAVIDQKIPLTAEQRRRLTDVTISRTEPPESVGGGSYGYYFVLSRMAEIPESEIKPVFSDVEWKALRTLLEQRNVVAARPDDEDFEE
jgi:hypothetical protein